MVPGYIGCYVYYDSDDDNDEMYIIIQYTEVFNRMMTLQNDQN